jgi:hypothetical protein
MKVGSWELELELELELGDEPRMGGGGKRVNGKGSGG